MRIDILSLFPEVIEGFVNTSILGRAKKGNLVHIEMNNIRDYSSDKHRSVDEPPYGGGGGMVLTPQPIFDSVSGIKSSKGTRIVLLTPQGDKFTQRKAKELAVESHLIFICGHYEGVDERVRQELVTDEISLGDFVLTGGEIAALAVVDSIVRLIPGVLGNQDSPLNDSFVTGLLEYPHYTRPREYKGLKVPEVLLSGHHNEIENWRRKESLRRTLTRRADLFNSYSFSENERKLTRQIISEELLQVLEGDTEAE